MPTIFLPKKEKKEKKNNPKYTDNKLLRRKFYNSTAWRKLRLDYLKTHALCSDCLANGVVKAAEDIHHIKSPFNYETGEINTALGLDENNLVALCKECHQKRHAKENNISPEELLNAFEELLKDIPD